MVYMIVWGKAGCACLVLAINSIWGRDECREKTDRSIEAQCCQWVDVVYFFSLFSSETRCMDN